jgi:hypothetical protein
MLKESYEYIGWIGFFGMYKPWVTKEIRSKELT